MPYFSVVSWKPPRLSHRAGRNLLSIPQSNFADSMKKVTGWLLVVLAVLIALVRISALMRLPDTADAASKMIPELLIVAGLGVWGLYLAGVVTAKK